MCRDSHRCQLTQTSRDSVKVAHILPTFLHEATESSEEPSWQFLGEWLGKERLSWWKDKLLVEKPSQDGENAERVFDTDRLCNMITLDTEVQSYWNDDLCAFRPVYLSEDKRYLDIAFHWLPLPERGTTQHYEDRIDINHHPYPDHNHGCNYTPAPGAGAYLYDAQTGKRILSGHIFRMETDDPVTYPLPSVELLEIQWYLKRLARFKGNLERYEDNFKSSYWEEGVTSKAHYWRYRDKEWDYSYTGLIWSDLEDSYANPDWEGSPESDTINATDEDESARKRKIEELDDHETSIHLTFGRKQDIKFSPLKKKKREMDNKSDSDADSDSPLCAINISFSFRP
ncbi:hypothetical protein N7456_008220 [Penicillium angulare]|uniref:HNH nuclease domain-containing protein n=1 Tax=Penicillium angulare TaxID=116970 RepID=A0A9W9K8X3_9EURO|nr:hypothetical protein N7456_008220 [Penicillium angulare]